MGHYYPSSQLKAEKLRIPNGRVSTFTEKWHVFLQEFAGGLLGRLEGDCLIRRRGIEAEEGDISGTLGGTDRESSRVGLSPVNRSPGSSGATELLGIPRSS